MVIRISRTNKRDDFFGYYFFTIFFLNSNLIVNIQRLLQTLLTGRASDATAFKYVVYSIPVIYLFVISLFCRIKLSTIIGLCFLLLISIVNYAIDSTLFNAMKSDYVIFFLRILPGYFLFSEIRDYRKLFEMQIEISIVIYIYAVLFLLVGYNDGYMGLSYVLLHPAMMLAFWGLENRKYLYCIMSFFLMGLILFLGARGAFIFAMIPIALYYLVEKRISYKKVIGIVSCILIGFTIYLNLYRIIRWLSRYFANSRTIRLLLAHDALRTGSRFDIYRLLVSRISFLPKGLFQDRPIVYSSRLTDAKVLSDAYPHNIVIEFLFQHGVLLGGIMIAILGICIFRAFMICHKSNNNYMKYMFYVFVLSYLLKAMISGSYLTDYFFGISIGTISCVIFGDQHKMVEGE